MPRPKLEAIILRDLRKLGRTPQQIAQTLRRRRIKGQRCRGRSCPIARYLTREYHTIVDVSHRVIVVSPVSVHTPRPIIRFLDRFDRGEYEYLNE